MLLVEALRLEPSPRLAFSGAGGKTTAMFLLGRQLIEHSSGKVPAGTVLLSASTHLAQEQLSLADHHVIVSDPDEVANFESELPEGLVLFTGAETEEGRVSGLCPRILGRLFDLAGVRGHPFLIETDGSRRRPLKAPAEHEPVIPPWVGAVVVVAGLSGLGRPLTPDWVHRPELFAALSGLAPGELITPQAVARVLCHPQGGLKGIPAGVRRLALLNQADTSSLQAQAHGLADDLKEAYQSVLVSALDPSHFFDTTDWPRGGVFAVHEPVAGIVLAAGGSNRLGKPKQVLLWRGEPLVRHVTRAAMQAGLSPLVVVTGHASEQVEAALRDMPVALLHNPDWMDGQSTSIVAGLSALPPEAGGAVFLLADQPQVSAGLVRGLIELHAQTLSPMVAPQIDGQRGNPVLFDRVTFQDLLALRGDMGGRALFAHYRVAWLPWHDSAALLDVDTPGDYQRLLEIE